MKPPLMLLLAIAALLAASTVTVTVTAASCDDIMCPAVVIPLPKECKIRETHQIPEDTCTCVWDKCSCGFSCRFPQCSHTNTTVTCPGEPCAAKNCAYGCTNDYCNGCNGFCWEKPYNPTGTTPPCDGICPAVVVPLPSGCQIRNENATSECLCEWDKCSCRWQCSIPAVTPCPNPVQCLIDPCSTAKCSTGTRCQSSYCGACTATCVPDSNPTDCPNPVQCLVDPCSTTTCSEGSTCQSSYCGACTATCIPNASGPTRPTPDCPNPVQCLVNPCASMLCASGTVCETDYCYGCNATCKPIATEKPPMNCDGVKCVDPCIRMTCETGNTCVKTDCCSATCAPTNTVPTNANDTSAKCLYNGHIYSSGQTFEDSCNTCACNNGQVICTTRACDSSTSGISNGTCIYNGQTYTPGQSVKATDGCNTCTCTNNGGMACTLMACSSTGSNNNVTCTVFGHTYTPGQSMLSLDGCNTCRCEQNGEIACTLMGCLNNTATYVGVTPTVLFATTVALAMIV